MPDYRLEIYKLKVQLSALANNLDRYYLEILESESRRRSATINIHATQDAIKRIEENLKSLTDEHGDVDVQDLLLTES